MNGIVESPLDPGPLRRCPECRRWFGLEPVKPEPPPAPDAPPRYRCHRCGGTFEVAKPFDPRALHLR
jgi:DNA-directed RNA polymerase subunit RPC12/RpoP